ncbi:hypothetical protein CSC94_19000 [Zhengella mangrovi]|uniref:Uncharacterized protein n=1 Tax=Zhengella mangrovi TaxID=1982044 RepID=A0A2G1QJP5_9HYPH|nr:hypothetical protein CSC94_19000 [Zhengella mangrovi]
MTGHDDSKSPIAASSVEPPTETTANDEPSNLDPDISEVGKVMSGEDRGELEDADLPFVPETSVADADATSQRISGDPHAVYPLSVDDIRSRLFALGISKSKDTVQRYCREGVLDCVKLGMFRRYFATEASVASLLATLQSDAAADSGMQLRAGEQRRTQPDLQVHAASQNQAAALDRDLYQPATNRMQVDTAAGTSMTANAAAGSSDAGVTGSGFPKSLPDGVDVRTKPTEVEGQVKADHEGDERHAVSRYHRMPEPGRMADPDMLDFLKEQLRVKDDQIKVKDEQIAAMLERDRETNILIRGLQDRIGEAFGLLVSGRKQRDDWPDPGNRPDEDDHYRNL